MSVIGTFTRMATGFSGRVRTLTLDAELVLIPIESADGGTATGGESAQNAPDYRVHLRAVDSPENGAEAGPQVGAGWKRIGDKAGEYVSLLIDDPALAAPIRANLFQTQAKGAAFHLLWNRLPRRD